MAVVNTVSSEIVKESNCEKCKSSFLSFLCNKPESRRRQQRKLSKSGNTTTHSKDRLPAKSSLCRTMTRGHLGRATNPQNTFFNKTTSQARSSRGNQQKSVSHSASVIGSRSGEESLSTKSVISSFSPVSKAERMETSIEKKSSPATPEKMAKLFESILGSGIYTTDVCSPRHLHTPSRSSRPRQQCYYSGGHHWTFWMAILVLSFISPFSVFPGVLCTPINQEDRTGGKIGLSTGSTQSSDLLVPNIRVWKEAPVDEPAGSYHLLNSGQLYIPSLLNDAPMKAAAAALASSEYSNDDAYPGERGSAATERERQPNSSNYHLQQVHHLQENREGNLFKHSAPIQKLLSQQETSSSRSVFNGKDVDDFEDDAARQAGENGENEDINSASKNLGQSEWETVLDPHLYVMTEWDSPPYQERFTLLQQQRKRRNSGTGPSLSIVNPLDVLRQRLLLEIARRRMRQSHNQIIANEEILRKIGRRRR